MAHRSVARAPCTDQRCTLRVPDVTILGADAPDEQVITHPPLAVFEVLSPEDTIHRMNQKLRDYSARGIREIWVVDPETSSFSPFEDEQLLRRDRFHQPQQGIDFAVREIAAIVR